MMRKVKEGMISDKVSERIAWLSVLFVIVFFGTTTLSFFCCRKGFC